MSNPLKPERKSCPTDKLTTLDIDLPDDNFLISASVKMASSNATRTLLAKLNVNIDGNTDFPLKMGKIYVAKPGSIFVVHGGTLGWNGEIPTGQLHGASQLQVNVLNRSGTNYDVILGGYLRE